MTTKEFANQYFENFTIALNSIRVKHNQKELTYAQGLQRAVHYAQYAQRNNKKIIIIGNGGSASIASHLSVDFMKNGNIKALALNDSSMLTCYGNDFGYEYIFSEPIQKLAEKDDLVICISSSGKSKNILNAAVQARISDCKIVTLSGFDSDNPLLNRGDLSFYVPSNSYGHVETLHTLIVHSILDAKLYLEDKKDVFYRNEKY